MEKIDRKDVTRLPVVGIGASAGGLEALNDLVGAIPENSGFAFVIIQHLSPDHPSMMDQLLSSHTKIPVVKIEDGLDVKPDHIYVLPAGPSASIEGGTLHLHEREPERVLRSPIDKFFQSLAESHGRSAFGVILSGTGSDGTVGVRAIKSSGGFVIVQQSDSARFPGMPDSAAATGLVDFALKPAKIPERLIDIYKHRSALLSDKSSEEVQSEIKGALPEIVEIIDQENGHDFSEYKHGTLVRRVERRMTVVREPNVSKFIARLRKDDVERSLLLQDFLIGVTRFFRDEDIFVKLKQDVILPLLDRDQSAFRVWVPGCATGEEAYSIAVLFAEAMADAGDKRQFQVFGTDIDSAALSHARAGLYSESQLDGISQERRDAFFVQGDTSYQVSPHLRERCIFAPHNLLQDPPFSRLDLISCRNLLIYLTAKIQSGVIPRFHYGLRTGGYLLLGPSESLGKQDKYFEAIDREVRLFKRNDSEKPAFSSLSDSYQDTLRRERRLGTPLPASRSGMAADRGLPEPNFEQQLLSFFARKSGAPFATVNASDEVTFISERMSRYIRPSQGQPSSSIDQFLLRDLRLPTKSVLSEARSSGETATRTNVVLSDSDDTHVVDIEAVPLPFAEGSVMITLQPVRTQDIAALTGTAETRSEAERDLIERDLAATKRQLAATQAGYETSEQELKSSNEELLSMNEELQSSNEELETSREELQSINEELETVNAELTENNRQLLDANSDLRNLFESTEIATVFLDQTLCVRRFTPASRRLFGIQDRDIGRPINDLKWRVDYDELESDAADVADTLQPKEREVRIPETDETFLMRVRPYRRTDDRIDGCVLTFVDITERKKTERRLAESADTLARQYAELETLYDTTPVGLCLVDKEMKYLRINERLAQINGLPVEDHIGQRGDELVPGVAETVTPIIQGVFQSGEPKLGIEITGETAASPGKPREWTVDYYPVQNEAGEVFAVGSCVVEVTEQKQLQRRIEETMAELAESEARLNFALETSELGAWELDITSQNAERSLLHDKIFGHDKMLSEWSFETFMTYVVEEDRDVVRRKFETAVKDARTWQFQCRICRADGALRWIEAHGRPRKDSSGATTTLMGTIQDITMRKQAEVQQAMLLDELQHRVKNTMATTLAIVQFSARRAADKDSFVQTLRNRLEAISRTHDLLTSSEWRGATLREIIKPELEPYIDANSNRVSYHGENPTLSSKQVLSLTLAVHELATNAVKYGALSNPEGQIVIDTKVQSGNVTVTWKEKNGPAVTAPKNGESGFGSFLLQNVLGPDLEGEASLEFHKSGIVWTVSFLLDLTDNNNGLSAND